MDKPPLITLVMNISFYVLLSILLILWILSIICRRYRVYTRNRRAVNIVGSPTNLDLPHGLDSSVIDTFPKFCYTRADQGAEVKSEEMKMRGGECVVCLGGFEEKETLRLLPKCGHVFHADCIDTWLRLHATCPFCRDNLLPESTATETATAMAIDEGSTRVDEVVIDVNDGRER